MYRSLLSALAGLTLPGFLPELTPLWFSALLLLVGAIVVAFSLYSASPRAAQLRGAALMLSAFALGFGWASAYGQRLVDLELPAALAGQDLLVTGTLDSAPERDSRRYRFVLAPEPGAEKMPPRVQLSWYGAPAWLEQARPGDRLQLRVRLRAPRSFINPAGFDYKLWQLRRGVGAQGYVRKSPENQRLSRRQDVGVKERLALWLVQEAPRNRDVLRALLLGDRGELTDNRWALFRATGTSHLIAISGLHIGLAAALGYVLGTLLGRGLTLLLGIPAYLPALLLGACCAWAYSALAGFSLPTQRALVMVLLFYLARLAGWLPGGGLFLAAAAVVVCVLDPLSVYDAGFWLSFLAVASLALVLGGAHSLGRHRYLAQVWQPQWAVFIALAVPLAAVFGELSLVSPVANVVAIALVSLWVVPCLFAGALASFIAPVLAAGFLWLADRGLDLLWLWLEALIRGAEAIGLDAAVPLSLAPGGLWLLGLACLLWLLPAPLRLMPAAVLLAGSALLLPSPKPPPLAVTVMDVGQGLAVVVRAGDKTLVYDTGPWFGPGFNAGADILAPYLKALGVKRVDALVVSHAHSDHAGGAAGLLESLPVEHFYRGERLKYIEDKDRARAQSCHTASPWQWQGVSFEFISPPRQATMSGNNASCVLRVSSAELSLLLPGDIETSTEASLAEYLGPVTALVAPHHGSLSSSSERLVMALNPELVVFSAGFNNRHGHPHPDVLERYRRQGSQMANTAEAGAVHFSADSQGTLRLVRQRALERRYWRD